MAVWRALGNQFGQPASGDFRISSAAALCRAHNTAFIACARMPLAALFGVFFLLALLLDRLGHDLMRRLERLLRTDNAI